MPFFLGIFATAGSLQDGLINFSFLSNSSAHQKHSFSSLGGVALLFFAFSHRSCFLQYLSKILIHNLRAFVLVASIGSFHPSSCLHAPTSCWHSGMPQPRQKGELQLLLWQRFKKICQNVLQEKGNNCVESQGQNVKPWKFREISSNRNAIKTLK